MSPSSPVNPEAPEGVFQTVLKDYHSSYEESLELHRSIFELEQMISGQMKRLEDINGKNGIAGASIVNTAEVRNIVAEIEANRGLMISLQDSLGAAAKQRQTLGSILTKLFETAQDRASQLSRECKALKSLLNGNQNEMSTTQTAPITNIYSNARQIDNRRKTSKNHQRIYSVQLQGRRQSTPLKSYPLARVPSAIYGNNTLNTSNRVGRTVSSPDSKSHPFPQERIRTISFHRHDNRYEISHNLLASPHTPKSQDKLSIARIISHQTKSSAQRGNVSTQDRTAERREQTVYDQSAENEVATGELSFRDKPRLITGTKPLPPTFPALPGQTTWISCARRLSFDPPLDPPSVPQPHQQQKPPFINRYNRDDKEAKREATNVRLASIRSGNSRDRSCMSGNSGDGNVGLFGRRVSGDVKQGNRVHHGLNSPRVQQPFIEPKKPSSPPTILSSPKDNPNTHLYSNIVTPCGSLSGDQISAIIAINDNREDNKSKDTISFLQESFRQASNPFCKVKILSPNEVQNRNEKNGKKVGVFDRLNTEDQIKRGLFSNVRGSSSKGKVFASHR